MSVRPPALLPIFRSAAQAAVLSELYGQGEEWSLAELAERTGVSAPTVQREVDRLEEAGLVVSRRRGRARLVRANDASPYFGELQSLLRKAFGPVPVIADALGGIAGIDAAYLYGSWARRHHGEPGPAPADIDVLVVGEADVDALFAAAQRAEQRLGRPVNVTLLAADEWERSEGAFLGSVRAGPLVPVVPA